MPCTDFGGLFYPWNGICEDGRTFPAGKDFRPYDEYCGDYRCPDNEPYNFLEGTCKVATPAKTLGEPSCEKADKFAGNPCNAANGNKYQQEIDYDGGNGLRFVRHYNSGYSRVNRRLGYGWSYTGSAKLSVEGDTATLRQDDGRGESFSRVNGVWQSDADSRLRLTEVSGGYSITDGQGQMERYNSDGLLISRTDRHGNTTTFQYTLYNPIVLSSITGPF